MTTTEQRLADALRDIDSATRIDSDTVELALASLSDIRAIARDALAAYDAQQAELPTEFRVTVEYDAFDATTPREAAEEVWESIRASNGPIFTVYGRDGSVTDIDLEDEA